MKEEYEKIIKEGEELLQEAKITEAYLQGYRHGLEEAKRIEESPGYAMSVLLGLASKRA